MTSYRLSINRLSSKSHAVRILISRKSTAVEQITRRKPASFAQFAKDHAESFRSVGRRRRRRKRRIREDMRIQYIVGLIGHYSTQIPEAATFLKICAEMTVLAGYFDSLV